ncbi:hypothetical protein J437_LFUL014718 [Ladona fulva]|uniref:Perilipin n=1 Tax=Ladona fulva TaxID=123851 RepID=A0A8K0P1V5_LADFU|nr:hypothetical protein J437_LFUL014718 [Ladona fulva]
MTDVVENNEGNETSNTQLQSLQRFSKIPVVELMWNHTTGMYEKVKGSNSVVNWTLSSAEATVQKAMQHAAPVAKRFEQPIQKVDETLCKGLNTLEEKVPIVKEKPEQVYEAAKTYVNATMQPAMEKVEAVKRFGTACGNYAKFSLHATVEMADQYVEYYLPENNESTDSTESTVAVQTLHEQSVPQKVGRISVRVGKGLYRTIVTQMKSLEVKSEKSLVSLTSLSELIHMTSVTMDGSVIAARASQLWSQLKLDEEADSDEDKGEKPAPGNVAMAAVVARRLVKNVLKLCTQAAKSLPVPPGPLAATASTIPSQLRSRLETAADYAKGMYTQLTEMNFHEASDSIKSNMKEQVGKIQTVMKDLNSYASQWLEANQPNPEDNSEEKESSQKEENGTTPMETTSDSSTSKS